jgi:GNAT superfamily N-acetyltransferase
MKAKAGLEVTVRAATVADAVDIIDVHHAAVHKTASSSYPPEILDNWSREPDERRYQQMRDIIAKGDELVLVAEGASGICGFGSIVPQLGELRAVYVHPDLGRRGIGSQITAALERLALAKGVADLQMDASINAEPFYRWAGYSVIDRGTHRLSTGHEMACVKMVKSLRGQADRAV